MGEPYCQRSLRPKLKSWDYLKEKKNLSGVIDTAKSTSGRGKKSRDYLFNVYLDPGG